MKRHVLPGLLAVAVLTPTAIAVGDSEGPPAPRITNVRGLNPAEARSDTARPVVALETANRLLNEGRQTQNPYLLGLASIVYFQANRAYALSLLSEATKVAERNGDARSLRWLADVWASPVLGAGDAKQQQACLSSAERAASGVRTRGGGDASGRKSSSMFPAGFFGQE